MFVSLAIVRNEDSSWERINEIKTWLYKTQCLLEALWGWAITGNQTESCSEFHWESCDNLRFFHIFNCQCYGYPLWWHISWKVWFIYLNVCCCYCCSCCWVNVNKSKKMVSLVAKIEYVIINSNWTQEIKLGWTKKEVLT